MYISQNKPTKPTKRQIAISKNLCALVIKYTLEEVRAGLELLHRELTDKLVENRLRAILNFHPEIIRILVCYNSEDGDGIYHFCIQSKSGGYHRNRINKSAQYIVDGWSAGGLKITGDNLTLDTSKDFQRLVVRYGIKPVVLERTAP